MGNLAIGTFLGREEGSEASTKKTLLSLSEKINESTFYTRERLEEILRTVTIGGQGENFETNLKAGMYRPDLILQSFFKELQQKYLKLM